ncbi:MAG: 4-(cytidine 5'-diphospho)-2-C-methyl-D-erythritol kinase [Fusobacterium sp.]|uniref:4-(cytidine 5'-diphospho)-2-C-methyl-D-erythritol kinase n=1 Tax=Fusobacterium sp. TaxID=68766 RepID=UPI0026DBA2D6|nr:4-(cytidine 5'-diphospho)-2-C-methyl-D-erythritol kinase [Fusobacterium sp.]MDO4691128.1 4-(cytidine 5'-diphospho)-2-C-methyl-D-erythritol kinase [Fusobacterium sp.]
MRIFLNRCKLLANAKINLGLNVYKKEEDGYHSLDTIMLPIDLNDELEIELFNRKGSLKIVCSDKNIPVDNKNILYKVYKKFFESIKKDEIEINIFLKKNIPTEAGLGGGSSNAAVFLKKLNEYYNNYFNIEDLIKIAFKIGSDVPFFISNRTSRVMGRGEFLKEIENKFKSSIVLIKPNFGISTKLAYDEFDKLESVKYSNLEEIEKGLIRNDIYLIEKNIENSLEQAMKKEHNLKLLKDSLKVILPNKKFFMTGSGSVLFTFVTKNEIELTETRLKTFLDNIKIFICNIQN